MPATVTQTTTCTHLGVLLMGIYSRRKPGASLRGMGYGFGRFARGAGYLLRGLRDGRMSLVAVGCLMIVRFLVSRRGRSGKVTEFRLNSGSRVELRVK